jgi:hypothetical protein
MAMMTCVAALPQYLQFVTDSQDVEAVREHIGPSADDYDSFFVSVANGDYTEVWGMSGIVPRLSNLVTRLPYSLDEVIRAQ